MMNDQIDKFGQFPIIQFAAAVVVLIGLAIAVWRGGRDRPRRAGSDIASEQRWFFDGPLARAFSELRDVKNHQERTVEISTDIRDELRKQTDALHEIKTIIEHLPSRRSRR